MKIKFIFKKIKNLNYESIVPFCVSINNTIQECNICNYLLDIKEDIENEGMYYSKNIKELKSKKYETIISGREEEGWTGNVIGDRIFFSFDFSPEKRESQAEILRKDMIELLDKWYEFVKGVPDLGYEEVVDLLDSENNPTVYSEAYFGNYETFIMKFKEGQQYEKDLLYTAFCNSVSEEKYKIMNFLLSIGAVMRKRKDME